MNSSQPVFEGDGLIRRTKELIRFLFFLDRIYRINGIFFACGERSFGRRLLYPVDPVQLLIIDKESIHPTFLTYKADLGPRQSLNFINDRRRFPRLAAYCPGTALPSPK